MNRPTHDIGKMIALDEMKRQIKEHGQHKIQSIILRSICKEQLKSYLTIFFQAVKELEN